MRTNITLEQALEKASKPLQEKILYSVNLLRKAEHIAKYYGGGYFPSLRESTQVYGADRGGLNAPRLTA